MKRVIIIPVADAAMFSHMVEIASAGSILALAGDTTPNRCRGAFDDEETFRHAVARGDADLHTFDDLTAAVCYAREKLAALMVTEELLTNRMNAAVRSLPGKKGPGSLPRAQRRKRAS